jgi:hypothetical protein
LPIAGAAVALATPAIAAETSTSVSAQTVAACKGVNGFLTSGNVDAAEALLADLQKTQPLPPCVRGAISKLRVTKIAKACALARTLKNQGDFDEAAKNARAALAIDSAAPCATKALTDIDEAKFDDLCAQAKRLDDDGRADDAEKTYQSAVALDPSKTCSRRNFGRGPDDWATRFQNVLNVLFSWAVVVISIGALLFVFWLLIMAIVGWAVRLLHRWGVRRYALVPRVRIAEFDGDSATGFAHRVRSVARTSNPYQLDFLTNAGPLGAGVASGLEGVDPRASAIVAVFLALLDKTWPWAPYETHGTLFKEIEARGAGAFVEVSRGRLVQSTELRQFPAGAPVVAPSVDAMLVPVATWIVIVVAVVSFGPED